jgi:hypothetical protein
MEHATMCSTPLLEASQALQAQVSALAGAKEGRAFGLRRSDV